MKSHHPGRASRLSHEHRAPESAASLARSRLLSTISLAALLISALPSCGAPPASTPQVSIKAPPASPSSEPSPLTPARWVDSSGSTAIGPTLPGGTLVLLGGRRALIAKDGSTRVETSPCPEGLFEIIQVPTERGETRLIGRGARGIYRFDDPLGAPVALARSESRIDHIGAGPGLIAVWDFQSYQPRFIDVETGQLKPFPGLPALPLRAVAFKNMKEGAGAFEAAGLAITADGGATWRLVADTSRREALRVTGLRLHEGSIRAYVYSPTTDAEIDFAKGALGPMKTAPEAPNEALLLRWIRVTERDPLEAAAASGVEWPAGGALIASHGLLARVDTKTGILLELAEFARGEGLTPCAMSRSGGAAWVGCTLSDEGDASFSDAFGLFRAPLAGPRLTFEAPAMQRSGEAEVRVSPSGGAMLLAPCSMDDEGDVCVRQPDGSFTSLRLRTDLYRSGAGPLADGRVAFVRGLDDGDEPPEDTEPTLNNQPSEEGAEEGAPRRRLYVAAVDRSGKEQRLAPMSWPGTPGQELRVQSPIEEDEDHTLRLVLADEEGIYAVVQPHGHDAATPQRIPQTTHARIHAGRGIAVGEGRVLSSADGGSTWIEAALPPRVREALDELGDGFFDEPGTLAVSEVGARVDTRLRIGWGHADADAVAEPKSTEPRASLPQRPTPAATGREQALVCSTAGAGQSTPPLSGAYEVQKLFSGGKPAPKPPKGKRISSSSAPTGHAGLLDTMAILEEQGSDAKGALPSTWTLRWVEASEVGSKPRSWTGPPPKGAAFGASLRSAAAAGGRALFSVRVGSKYMALRVKAGGGGIEAAEIEYELLPTHEVVFGTDKGEPIAWAHDNTIIVWLSGEAPRVLSTVGGRAMRALGQPTRSGVPVLLSFSELTLLGTLPIPPLARSSTGPSAVSAPPPVPVALDGWVPVTNVRREMTRLPACGAKAKGARFLLPIRQLNLQVDGVDHAQPDALYDVRLSTGEACVVGLAALVSPGARPSAAAAGSTPGGAGKPAKTPAVKPGPVTFVRVDLGGKRAEGGSRGVPGSVRKLQCALRGKP